MDYIVDSINEAIDARRKVSFCYTDYDVHKKRCLANDGKPYTVSPYTLIWDGDYYYLRGFCDERDAMRTFRLDRIKHVPTILRDPAVPKPENYNVAKYTKSVFQMYDTDQPVEVELFCKAGMMKVLIDHFGMDMDTVPVDEEHFKARVLACTSPTFYRWVFGFGGDIRIMDPQTVVEEYRSRLTAALADYDD